MRRGEWGRAGGLLPPPGCRQCKVSARRLDGADAPYPSAPAVCPRVLGPRPLTAAASSPLPSIHPPPPRHIHFPFSSSRTRRTAAFPPASPLLSAFTSFVRSCALFRFHLRPCVLARGVGDHRGSAPALATLYLLAHIVLLLLDPRCYHVGWMSEELNYNAHRGGYFATQLGCFGLGFQNAFGGGGGVCFWFGLVFMLVQNCRVYFSL